MVNVMNTFVGTERSSEQLGHDIPMFGDIRGAVRIGMVGHPEHTITRFNVGATFPPTAVVTTFAFVGRWLSAFGDIATLTGAKDSPNYCGFCSVNEGATGDAVICLFHEHTIPQMDWKINT